MTSYHNKLVELLAVEQDSDKSYLRIRLSFQGNLELLWEIDHDTAENLKEVTSFEGSHKYRLSFHCTWDTIQNQYVSYLTRTHLDQSDRIYFPCHEEYVNSINAIKGIQHISEIHKLPYISNHIETIDELELDLVHEQEKSNYANCRLPWTSFALSGCIFIILFGLGYSSFSNNFATNKKAVVNAQTINKEVIVAKEDKKIDNQTEVPSSEQSTSIPVIEINEATAYRVPDGSVALTFDDGPSKYSKAIVDILKAYQVGGTFFYNGVNVAKHKDSVHYVKANGYSIGNHSMNHSLLTRLNYVNQEKELIASKQILEEITGEKVTLFRPPYGAMNEATIDLAKKHGNKLVFWNIDPKDWKTRNSDKIINYILNSNPSGSIILLHESQYVVDALPRIIEYLQGKDLKIVSLK